jgi:hypothetical protein
VHQLLWAAAVWVIVMLLVLCIALAEVGDGLFIQLRMTSRIGERSP